MQAGFVNKLMQGSVKTKSKHHILTVLAVRQKYLIKFESGHTTKSFWL